MKEPLIMLRLKCCTFGTPRLAPAILWRRANLTRVPTVGLGSVCKFDGNEIVTPLQSQNEAVGRTPRQRTRWHLQNGILQRPPVPNPSDPNRHCLSFQIPEMGRWNVFMPDQWGTPVDTTSEETVMAEAFVPQ